MVSCCTCNPPALLYQRCRICSFSIFAVVTWCVRLVSAVPIVCALPLSDGFPSALLYSRNADVGRVMTMVAPTIKEECLYDPACGDERSQEGKRKLKVRARAPTSSCLFLCSPCLVSFALPSPFLPSSPLLFSRCRGAFLMRFSVNGLFASTTTGGPNWSEGVLQDQGQPAPAHHAGEPSLPDCCSPVCSILLVVFVLRRRTTPPLLG